MTAKGKKQIRYVHPYCLDMASLYELASALLRGLYDRRIADGPVLDIRQQFPLASQLVDIWPQLRDEALRLADHVQRIPRFHELLPSQTEISANDQRDWRMLVVKAYGVPIRENLARCPLLAMAISAMPEVLSAAISIIGPGKHIPPHRGPFRGVVRFYLGLSVPATADGVPATVLNLDGEEYRIGNGEYLLWDDTFTHEVCNQSDQLRIALLLDIRRRHMPLDMRLLSQLLIYAASLWIRIKRLTGSV